MIVNRVEIPDGTAAVRVRGCLRTKVGHWETEKAGSFVYARSQKTCCKERFDARNMRRIIFVAGIVGCSRLWKNGLPQPLLREALRHAFLG